MRALKDGGILSVTLWNKEEPPKSVLKLYATMAEAARAVRRRRHRRPLLRGVELSVDRDRALQARRLHARGDRRSCASTPRAMSFDEIYYPGFAYDTPKTATRPRRLPQLDLRRRAERTIRRRPADRPRQARRGPPADERRRCPPPPWASWPGTTWCTAAGTTSPSATCSTPAPLTNDRPYFAAYVKPARPAARHRPAGAVAGRVGLSAALGDARHRLHRRPVAGAAAAGLRLAHDLQPQPRQVPHHRLFRLPRRRLHHGRGRPDLEVHPGAEQRHRLGLRADHRHAGVLRPRQLRLRALPRPRAHASCRASSSPSARC